MVDSTEIEHIGVVVLLVMMKSSTTSCCVIETLIKPGHLIALMMVCVESIKYLATLDMEILQVV